MKNDPARLAPAQHPSDAIRDDLDIHVSAYEGRSLYDFDNEILLRWYPERVLAYIGDAVSLLDLGLGHGFTSKAFAGHFPRHVVLEGSPAVIRNFRDLPPESGLQIVETLFEEFNTEERFDVVVMGFVLEHVDDPVALIRHYRQFLAPRGRLFAAVPNADALNRRLGHLAGLLEDLGALSANDAELGHKRYYTVSSLRTHVEEAGGVVDWMEGIYLKPFTTSQIISLDLDRRVITALCEVGKDYPELSCGILAQISDR
jgi:2-polyprenyl-3-methyl-5-hydroxy-6-metoxy-1,4-benzoquinol methylase